MQLDTKFFNIDSYVYIGAYVHVCMFACVHAWGGWVVDATVGMRRSKNYLQAKNYYSLHYMGPGD